MRQANDALPPDAAETPAPASPLLDALTPVKVTVAIAGVVALVIMARSAFDLFVLLVLLGFVGVLRRTAGDWLGDVLGMRAGTIVFAMAVAIGGWWLVGTDGGQATVGQFFSEAGRLGFNSVLKERVIVPPSTRPPTSGSSTGPMIQLSPGATTGSGRAPSPAASPVERRAAAGAAPPPVTPTRLTVRATTITPDRIVLHAMVSASGDTPGGRVEFRIDGRVVATARIGYDGSAEATVSVARGGSYRVQARFEGDNRFGPAIAETSFTI